MQALADDQRIESLEQKIDDGFAEMRGEFKDVREQIVMSERALRIEIDSVRDDVRSIRGEVSSIRGEVHAVRSELQAVRSDGRGDIRTLIAVVLAMWITTILTFVGVLAANL